MRAARGHEANNLTHDFTVVIPDGDLQSRLEHGLRRTFVEQPPHCLKVAALRRAKQTVVVAHELVRDSCAGLLCGTFVRDSCGTRAGLVRDKKTALVFRKTRLRHVKHRA